MPQLRNGWEMLQEKNEKLYTLQSEFDELKAENERLQLIIKNATIRCEWALALQGTHCKAQWFNTVMDDIEQVHNILQDKEVEVKDLRLK